MPTARTVCRLLIAGLLLAVVPACDDDPTGTDGGAELSIAIEGGDGQYGVRGHELDDPLQVVVTEAAAQSFSPVDGAAVTWEIIDGSGAALSATTSTTDSLGVASTRLTLGQRAGTYRVRASVDDLVGEPVTFEVTAVGRPRIESISSAPFAAGDTVTIRGENFSPEADDLAVLFGDIHAVIIEAESDRILAVVPRCVETGTTAVVVTLASVPSEPVPVDVQGNASGALRLEPGEVAELYDPAALSCVVLPGESGARYLIVPQNGSTVAGRLLSFRLQARTSQEPLVDRVPSAGRLHAAAGAFVGLSGFGGFGAEWEARLRAREHRIITHAIRSGTARRPRLLRSPAARAVPEVGDTRQFKVISDLSSVTVDTITAEVKFVSDHGIFYEDVDAPEPGLSAADYDSIANLFDDPIYTTDVDVFGSPSDIDGNQRVIILFTPVVNSLTPEDANGFVAGFFYACDLLPNEGACAEVSNGAEIFYSIVPDPQGEFGKEHTREDIFERVAPSVLAHEFQHMISFNQRVFVAGADAPEALWLSEGLAHMAEDTVGGVLLARGHEAAAFDFRVSNYARGIVFLGPRGATAGPGDVSLIGIEEEPDARATLEERGAAWLFLKYLEAHPELYGIDLLAELTRTRLSSIGNVTQHAGEQWKILLNRWAVALFADGAPALEGDDVGRKFVYPGFDLRRRVRPEGGDFPLQPTRYGFEDFVVTDTLPSSSPGYLIVNAGVVDPPRLRLNFVSESASDATDETRPQISVLRLN